MALQIDCDDFLTLYNQYYPDTFSTFALVHIYITEIDDRSSLLSVDDVHEMFTEIEASGKFYEQFMRADMPACIEVLDNGRALIKWYKDPMPDEQADYKLSTLEDFIEAYRSEPHLPISDEALEFMFTITKIRNGNVSLAIERTLFTDEPAEGRAILKLDNGKTLTQVYRY